MAVGLGALLLTGCQLPTFGAYKGATSQAQSTFRLWQGFFIAGIVVGGFTLLLIVWAIFRYRRRSDEMPGSRSTTRSPRSSTPSCPS